MTVATAEPRTAEAVRTRTGIDRLLAAFPLTLMFLAVVVIYAYQAWAHHTPWLFSDEIEYTDLSRAIASTGHAALRGEPHSSETLYTWLIAPVWWLHSTAAAYAAAKYVGVVVMSASLFPAYFLARMLVRPPAALVAGALTASAPALGYSAFIVLEPLAYTWSALTCFLVVKALATRRRWWMAAAAVSLLVAPSVRDELKVLIPATVGAGAWMLWTSARAERIRAGWGLQHWVGLAILIPIAAYGFSEAVGLYSGYWREGVHELGSRMVQYGNWAAGSLVIGLGVLPVVVGLTVLARPREPRTPAFRAFVGLFGASIALFWLYTAIKAAYLSTVFATRVEERNMIYLTPLVAVAFAVFLDRPRVRLWALALSGAIVGYLVASTPYQLSIRPYSDAPGLSVLGWASDRWHWADPDVKKALFGAVAFALVFALVVSFGRRLRPVVVPLCAAVALGVVVWALTGETSFANASNGESGVFVRYLPHPLDWIDRATGREPTAYIGQQMSEGNGTWSLEFWNRSLVKIGSLDGTAPGPGGPLRPVPYTTDGRVVNDPSTPYLLAGAGVEVQGAFVTSRGKGTLRLYRIHGPLRLRSFTSGIFADGWTGDTASYTRFVGATRGPGKLTILLSREGWKGGGKPASVLLDIGTLHLPPLKTIENPCALGNLSRCASTVPTIGRVLARRSAEVPNGGLKKITVRVTPPFQVELATTTFSPSDFGVYDSRKLGVQAQFSWAPLKR